MRIHYFHDSYGNFGDDLNLWLWPRVLPGASPDGPDPLLLGIGTVLHARLPREPFKVVLGAGVGYGELPLVDERWRFYAVRGPGTAAALGLPPELAITDSAALITDLVPPGRRTGRVAFMPHHISRPMFDWRSFCNRLGLTFLDPWASVDRTLAQMAASRCVISGAMHAAIVADALRIPWVPIAGYEHINAFKWQDWTASLRMDYAPVHVPALHDQHRNAPHIRLADYVRHSLRTGQLTRFGPWKLGAPSDRATVQAAEDQFADLARNPAHGRLSADDVLRERVNGLKDALARLKADWPSPAGQ